MMDADKVRQFLDSNRWEFIKNLDTFEVMNRLMLKNHIREKIQCRKRESGNEEANAFMIDEVKRNSKLLIQFIDVVREYGCEDLANLIDAKLKKGHQSQRKSSTPHVEKLKMREMHAEPAVEQTTRHGIEEAGACAATNDLSPNVDTSIHVPPFGVDENTVLPNQKVFPSKQFLVVTPKCPQARNTEQSPENNTEYHSFGSLVAQENCDGDMTDDDTSWCINSEEVEKAFQLDDDQRHCSDVASGINEIKSLKNEFGPLEEGTADSVEENRDMNVENVSEGNNKSPSRKDFEGKKVYNTYIFNHYEKSNVQLGTEGSKITQEKAKKSQPDSRKPIKPDDCKSANALEMDRAMLPVSLHELNESEESSISHDYSQTDLKKVDETCQSDIVNSEPNSVLNKPDEYASQESSVTSDQSETCVKEVVQSDSIVTDTHSESSLSTPLEVRSENSNILNLLKQGFWRWYNGIK